MSTLFHSDVLEYNFDFDHWPGTSYNTESKQAPYNHSIFEIRDHYKSVFPELVIKELTV